MLKVCMKSLAQITATILLMLLLTTTSRAQFYELTLTSNKTVYNLGDTMVITAEVRNTKDYNVSITIEAILSELMSRIAPTQLYYSLNLGSNETRQVQLFSLLVDQSFYSGTYKVHARLIEDNFAVCEEEIQFEVQGAPEVMEVEILLSKDSTFAEKTHVFIKNEKIFIGFSSNVQDVSIDAKLTLPDNSSKLLTLPTNITAKQAGAYTLEVNASKQGYRNITLTEFFAVLEEDPILLQFEKMSSDISLQASKNETIQGESVQIYGDITPSHADTNVNVTYKKDGETRLMRLVVTNDDGHFSDIFQPDSPGEWTVIASWEGDSNHIGAVRQISLKVTAPFPWILAIGIAVVVVCIAIIAIALLLRKRPQTRAK
jgi:hypothetical protein